MMRTHATIGLITAFVLLTFCPSTEAFGRRCRPARCGCSCREADPCAGGGTTLLAIYYCNNFHWDITTDKNEMGYDPAALHKIAEAKNCDCVANKYCPNVCDRSAYGRGAVPPNGRGCYTIAPADAVNLGPCPCSGPSPPARPPAAK